MNESRASKGGKARAAKLTPEQRSESARKAVKARWAKQRVTESLGTFYSGAGYTFSNLP